MKLYADYILEREGTSLITHEHGFIAYKIVGEECFVSELFVSKEHRQSNIGTTMFKELLEKSLSENCKVITGNIHLWDAGATTTLKALLSRGFKVTGANNQVLLVSKIITEE